MLQLINVSKYYHSGSNVVLALRNINLTLRMGEFVVITGESGSGKSTLLNVLSGLDSYEDGKVLVDGVDLTYYTVDELERYRRDYISFVFQDYNIIASYTVYQNVELALTVQGIGKDERHQLITDIIDRVGLTAQMHKKAALLSGGEQQRTVIARSLAKNSSILVCDEPTGNLDPASGAEILKLLHDISKDKLVIVVTHDFEAVAPYASRKIRLYDGEILEDKTYRNEETTTAMQPVTTFQTAFADVLRIAWNNVVNVPKKTLFMFLILVFLLAVTMFTYGNGIADQNRPYSFTTPYFANPDQSRVIITKYDETAFDADELDTIDALEYVRTVLDNDAVYDTILLNRTVDPRYQLEVFYEFRVLPAAALDPFDLIAGTLPTAADEIVISDRTQYQIGDVIGLDDTYLNMPISGMVTDQFTFEVVGITSHSVRIDDDLHTIYATDAGLADIARSTIYSRSDSYLEVSGTTKYITPIDTWITPDVDPTVPLRLNEFALVDKIRIDNSLDDFEVRTYDMMFYDICRDFDYKKEIVDDMDAGLCNVADFLATHAFRLSAVTTFESEQEYVDISFLSQSFLENGNDQNLYMNDATYAWFFGEQGYQVTAVVYDVFEGKQVASELEALGYNVFYPALLLPEDEAVNVLMTNIRILLVILITLAGMFLVGYLVLRNIIMSKQRDYLILRTLGTSKRVILDVVRLEILYVLAAAIVLVWVGIFALEQFDTQVPLILRYFHWYDYVVMFVGVVLVLQLMIHTFGRRIFDVNLIATLKGMES